MRFLLECTPDFLNVGDVAMLTACLRRLRKLCPKAGFSAFTCDPKALEANCPGVEPVPAASRDVWLGALGHLDPRTRALAGKTESWLTDVVAKLRFRFPDLTNRLVSHRLRHDPATLDQASRFYNALRGSDLFVLVGMGSFTSDFEPPVLSMMETVALAKSLGLPVLAFSQGIGPIARDSNAWAVARRSLSRFDFVTLREGLESPKLLKNIGLSESKMRVTGDDAIELALREGPSEPSGQLGVNLRVAPYSGWDTTDAVAIAARLRGIASGLGARIAAVPISWIPGFSDVAAFECMFPDIAGEALKDARPTTEWTIRQAGRCRVMVTGAYHAAVFSLSQGIPAVCLANSAYYRQKFEGLAAQFGEGCRVLSAGDLDDGLAGAISGFWQHADRFREPLLARAKKQNEANRAAWSELPSRIPLLRTPGTLPTAEKVSDFRPSPSEPPPVAS